MQSEIESLKTDKVALNTLLLKITERFRSTVMVLETSVELPRDVSEALAPAPVMGDDGGGDPEEGGGHEGGRRTAALDRLQQVGVCGAAAGKSGSRSM